MVKLRLEGFATWNLEHIPRDLNEKADVLVAIVASLPLNGIPPCLSLADIINYYQPGK